MGKIVLAIIAANILVACDADGAPTRPTQETKSTGTGVTVSGSARFGVVYGPERAVDRN
jgi:hypothetical protein